MAEKRYATEASDSSQSDESYDSTRRNVRDSRFKCSSSDVDVGAGGSPAAAEREPKWTRENRIRANHFLLDQLRALWDEYPDMRFGQLVMNISREPGGFADTWEWKHGEWRERMGEAYYAWKEAHSG